MNIRVPLLVALVWLSGCSQTQQISRSAPLAKDVKGSGFLGDLYPKLQDGEGDQALRIYRSPAFQNPAEFAQYTRVLLEPVVMYAAKDSKLAEVSAEEREHIADRRAQSALE